MAYNGVISVTPAAVGTEPITVNDVKAQYAKIDFADEDILIGQLITAAREVLEDYTNQSFVKRQITAIINNGCGGQELPMGPISGAVTYTDKDNAQINDVVAIGDGFVSVECPKDDYIKAVYQGGYESASLPKYFVVALKAEVLWLYEHRGDEEGAYDIICPVAKQLLVRQRRVFNEFFI